LPIRQCACSKISSKKLRLFSIFELACVSKSGTELIAID
jgi:hypothetical protein